MAEKSLLEDPSEPSSSPGSSSDAEEPLRPNRSLVPMVDSDNGHESGSVFSWLLRLFGRKRNGSNIREDLADALSDDQGLAQGFSPDERAMLTSILKLQDTRVEDLMVPRTDIIAVNQDITLAELLSDLRNPGTHGCLFSTTRLMILVA